MFELFKLLAGTGVDMTVLGEEEVYRKELLQKGFDVILNHRATKAYCRAVVLVNDMSRLSAADIVNLYFKPMMGVIERNKNLTQEEYEAVIAEEGRQS